MLVLMSQNLVESYLFLDENHALLRKKLLYLNIHFSILSPIFFLSFDLSLSCKLQLIDLIMVSAACLAGWQTILEFFLPRTVGSQEKKRKKWMEN